MRTHFCGRLTPDLNGERVELSGWAGSRRDHGGVIFIDLRDRTGIAQVVVDPDRPEAFAIADQVRNEFVIRIVGNVRPRPEGTENPDRPSGMVEVFADEIEILNRATPLPFQFDEDEAGEQVRLEYRYLDLRSHTMQRNLRFRAAMVKSLRHYLNEQDFVDIETPILTRSTPEGARDYLVPSRTYPGEFFALPQSPQLFKQLLMVSGFERYYQVARCFRDEDLRADRQPEFSQLDIEMSFINEEDIMSLMEDMIRAVFKELKEIDLPNPFPRMSYHESMSRFGVDRPDLRIPLELIDIADLMAGVEFKVFAGPANDPKGRVAAMRVPNGGSLSRQQIDQYTNYVGLYGAKGLAYIKVNELAKGNDGLQSPILKFLTQEAIEGIIKRTAVKDGDIVFFGADKADVVNAALGALRIKIGEDMELIDSDWAPVWVVDFPMFEYDAETKRLVAMHHPFTSPKLDEVDNLASTPEKVNARAYDMVLNGSEIGGGSIRIHDEDVQSKVFRALNIDDEEARNKFGFLLDALQLGAPPHGGIAFGLDRLCAMMLGVDSIRDVIAFPKTQRASCLMTHAPNEVSEAQLKELGLRLRPKSQD